MNTRSRAQRGAALGIAVTLITSGAAGLGATHGITIAKFTSGLAIIVGLVFLKMVRSKNSV